MLQFIIALQSPEASKHWECVQRLCQRTLRSVCGQTSKNFRALLVCNRAPKGLNGLSNLEVFEEPFPVPGPTTRERMDDKWRKIKRGLIEAKKRSPGYVMIGDADDCVSNRLAHWCETQPVCSGWSFDRAFIHDEETNWLFLRNDFSRLCGTSAIVWAEEHELPSSMSSPTENCFLLCHGHGVISEYLASVGRPLASLPFPGAVYCTGTGENDSGFRFGDLRSRKLLVQKVFNARYLSQRRVREFGLVPLKDC
jgi:hypothetical protein